MYQTYTAKELDVLKQAEKILTEAAANENVAHFSRVSSAAGATWVKRSIANNEKAEKLNEENE